MPEEGQLTWGELTDIKIRLQFARAKFDRLSFATTPIDIKSGDQLLGHASGFFWRAHNGVWLITNWHCVTGNNPFTNRVLNSGPAPSEILFYPLVLRTFDNGQQHIPTRIPQKRVLFTDGDPIWRQHSDFARKKIDIVAIKIECFEEDSVRISCVNDFARLELFHHVGADLFVVGYPLRNYVGWMPPFWKRGSFAGEPLLPMADKPLFPIDVLSTEGMSGSPVFRRVFGPRAAPDGSTIALENIVATEFVGVYAGRLLNKELDRVGIGYGWYGYLVDDIVADGIPGTTC